MARGQRTNRALVREAGPALDQFKYEIAQQLGVQAPPDGYWGDIPARVNGAIGGNMVRRMIQIAEQQMATNPAAPQQAAQQAQARPQTPTPPRA